MQLAVLDDASLTGIGQSSADVLRVPGTIIAERLTANLLRQIIARAVRGGPLAPLTSQLNHDRTHLQGRRLEGVISEVLEVLASLDETCAATPKALAQLPPPMTGFSGLGMSWQCWSNCSIPPRPQDPCLCRR